MSKIDFGKVVTAEEKAKNACNALREQIRRRRELAVNAGVVVEGMTFHTDDVSQQRIFSAAVSAMRDPTLIVKWKTASGAFVSLDAGAVLTTADAVRSHVQACYEREAALLVQLDAGDCPDVDSGWPV